MKKEYVEPMAIVDRLEQRDIICASGGNCNSGSNYGTSQDTF